MNSRLSVLYCVLCIVQMIFWFSFFSVRLFLSCYSDYRSFFYCWCLLSMNPSIFLSICVCLLQCKISAGERRGFGIHSLRMKFFSAMHSKWKFYNIVVAIEQEKGIEHNNPTHSAEQTDENRQSKKFSFDFSHKKKLWTKLCYAFAERTQFYLYIVSVVLI